MAKKLFIARHSFAEMGGGSSRQDFDRELTEQGLVLANKRGKKLYDMDMKPEALYSSTAVRATQTAKILADQMRFDNRSIKFDDALYNITLGDMLNWIGRLDENLNSVMIVGHNPVLSYLAEYLLDSTGLHMQPCDIVCIDMHIASWMLIDKNCGTQQMLDL